MKKGTVILLLIIQIILLFFLENMHSLMNVLAERERELSIERLITKAEYAVLRHGGDPAAIKKKGGFGFVSLSKNFLDKPAVEKSGNEHFLIFDVSAGSGKALRFREKLDSPFTMTVMKMKELITVFLIFLGIFTLLTGIYLIVLYKRKKPETSGPEIPFLQDYLSKLKESETALKGMVDQQSVNIKRSEEISKKIVNRISAGIILLNETGRIELFNPFAEKIFSRSPAFAINNTPAEVLRDFPELIRFIEENATKPASNSIISGKIIFLAEILPLSPKGTLIIIRDITEEKKKEELINSRKNFMMLGEMTSYLTHEIRNSLGVIFGYAKTLKDDSGKAGKINSEILFLTEMMEKFLNFSKPLNMKRIEDVEISDLIKDICGENDIDVDFSGESGCSLRTDIFLLRSVFSNLVLNAKEAGASQISVKYHASDDGAVSIWFGDNGSGIGGEHREKIWYPFYTSKPKGTGMGLAIVKKIINFLDGEINLIDSPEKGSTFSIKFYRRGERIGI